MRKKFPEDGSVFLGSASPGAEIELMLARGRAAAAKKAEAREQELRDVNRVQPHPSRQPDVFDRAKADWNARAEAEAQIMAQLEFELLMVEREARLRREHAARMRKIREILGPARFDAAVAESRRRRGKR